MTPDLIAADEESIARAGELIARGLLVAFPTETVYGLGTDATNDRAVASIFEAKGRPSFNPLIVHLPDRQSADRFVHFNAEADKLAHAFWPGGLTLVLPRRRDCSLSLLVSAGLDTVALRVPAHKVAHALLLAARCPIAAPSANASGRISPTRAEHVLESLGQAASLKLILDGGPCAMGLESTVIGFPAAGPTLLRPGAIAREAIEAVLGRKLVDAAPLSGEAGRSSPGQLESHYAPEVAIRLNARDSRAGESVLGFGPDMPEVPGLNLSATGDLREAAAHLFSMLRELDAMGKPIAVMPIPETGLGEAINDRLRRAAAPRGKV